MAKNNTSEEYNLDENSDSRAIKMKIWEIMSQ